MYYSALLKNIASNQFILDNIWKARILDLIYIPKANSKFPFPLYHLNKKAVVNNEVAKLKDKKVISKAYIKDKNFFVLGVFPR